MTPQETAILLAKALDSKKGIDIKVLETGHLTTLADYFVLCSATSTTQIKALADACEKAMKEEANEAPHHVEGHRGGTWILLDFSRGSERETDRKLTTKGAARLPRPVAEA